ncbi:hypothetical protein CJP74_00720 [Psittacicella melopsittaci]|uniref:Cytochrome c domain-containing protein n=1 Tax=Psittacicella melopsittaci TaxID=2028576 RepID=A0A3A1Y877_9GAMM|nr:hypothetical protein [Psittacicella melopsittaci]RIY33855.1 hypothetical protein CJP74_00720 [Psittacicella melopsittaci]
MKKAFLILLGLGCFTTASYAETLDLYGQTSQGKLVYLGCLNCSRHSTNSIFNDLGAYGFRYANSTNNIWNKYGPYGSVGSTYSINNYSCGDKAPLVIGRYSKQTKGTFCIRGYPSGVSVYSYREIMNFLAKNIEQIRDKRFSELTSSQQEFINKLFY